MKRFKDGMNRYWAAIMVEIRGGLTKTPLHILKTVVIFFIPFFYAFTYLWAFYDPIGKADDLDLTIVTSRNDALGDFVKATTTNKGIEIHNGPNVNIKARLNQIYDDQLDGPVTADSDVVKDSLLTVDVPDLDHSIVATLRNAISTWDGAGQPTPTNSYIESLAKTVGTFLGANTLNGKPSTNYNYKKNFLIGFATDISSAQSGGLNAVMEMLLNAVSYNGGNNIMREMIIGNVDASGNVQGQWIPTDAGDKPTLRSFSHHQWAAAGADPLLPTITADQFDTFMKAMTGHFQQIGMVVGKDGGLIRNANAPNSLPGAIEVITLHSQLGTDGHQDFGIGLSPFFISIGMWFGAVAMTVLIHRKIYDKKTYVKWRYMAKGTLINAGVIIQASVLMISLKFIGLDAVGSNHWAIMFGTAIFAGIVFATFIMAVRLSIPNRALSIYIIVIFMVLNIVCSGGLFPVPTQNGFVRAMNTWLPMHFSVEMLRQGLVDTDWATWGACFGYLSIYLLFVPIGAGANFIYTHRWYIRYNYDMPAHMTKYHEKWLANNNKRNKGITKRLRAAGRKEKRGGDY